jgi:hypothetical protein
MVFVESPDALLIVVPEGETMQVPECVPPFTRDGVASAFRAAGIDARVSDGRTSHWRSAIGQARANERAERGGTERRREAVASARLRSSPSATVRDHAAAMAMKHAVDDELRALKNRGEQSTPRAVFLKAESQALQVKLGQLRRVEHRSAQRQHVDALHQAMQETLTVEQLEDVRARAREIQDEKEAACPTTDS